MTHLWPKTLKIRAILLFSSIYLLSHTLSLILYEQNRDRIILLTQATDLAARIVSIVDLARSFPPQDKEKIFAAAETQFLAMFPDVNALEGSDCQHNSFAARMSDYFNEHFENVSDFSAEVCLRRIKNNTIFTQMNLMRGYDVLVTVSFPDSEQAVFHAVLPEGESLLKDSVLLYQFFFGGGVLLLAWYLILKVLEPLERLTRAADQVALTIDSPPLSTKGSHEIASTANAFNRMQTRLKGQTEMLASISHDLRSAVTRLQLRTELLKNNDERQGMLRVVEDMGLMVQSVIDFVRGADPNEAPKKTNLTALIQSLCENLVEEGLPVSYQLDHKTHILICRPVSFRRALQNLIDNAIKYGGEVKVTLEENPNGLSIYVDDKGSGIPEEDLTSVLKPFFRLDKSKKSHSGGVGLGLSITQNILHAHGGTMKLMNRPEGGLRVEINLPVQQPIES